MRKESPLQMNQNLQLKLIKSPLGNANAKSMIALSKIYNKNLKLKENQNAIFKETEYDKIGKIY